MRQCVDVVLLTLQVNTLDATAPLFTTAPSLSNVVSEGFTINGALSEPSVLHYAVYHDTSQLLGGPLAVVHNTFVPSPEQ
eukprot:scaffold145398_cov38-Prasinocladus_malaysianus.AAC.1